MFELKLGITIIVVSWIISKVLPYTLSQENKIALIFSNIDDDDYPLIRLSTIILSYVGIIIGIIYTIVALWKLL